MCVIIYIPKNSTISEKELEEAWTTNPHGAGFSIQKNGRVFFERGFMTFNDYYNAIKDYIGNYNLLLHLRISTSKEVNQVQTHPYKKGNVMLTKGITDRPVICMNGIISNQKEYLNCNDTMSYIVDHKEAFSNINQDILNIIEEATGAKWAVMTPDKVLLSSKFTKKDGRYYSNTNHLWRQWYGYGKKHKNLGIKDIIKKDLRKGLKKDKELYLDVLDFIDFNCNEDMCIYCTKCLKHAKTLRDIKITLNENYYGEKYYDEDDTYCLLNDKKIHYIDGRRMSEKEYLEYIDYDYLA